MLVKDKVKGNYSVYVDEGFGLTIDDFQVDIGDREASFVKSWSLSSSTKTYTGNTIDDLLDTLHKIKSDYSLKQYSKGKKDILIIYTNKFWELSCYLYNHIYNVFTFYYQIMNNIEFRACWDKSKETSQDIASWADYIIKNLFIPDEYYYLTPAQVARKRISTSCKKYGDTLAKDIFPATDSRYRYIKKSLFGGACYCPYPGRQFNEPMMEIDINSAYIYCFMLKHCVTSGKFVNTEHWQSYLNSPTKATIGGYKITYSSWSSIIKCYKNANGEHCKPTTDGPVTDTFVFTNIDLDIFLSTVNVISIECVSLLEYDMNYLPKSILDVVVRSYIEKEEAKKTGSKEERALKKIAVNSIYGNTIRDLKTRDEWKAEMKKACLSPQWGIFITSYCKSLLIGLGSNLDGWVYSDTDSIFCFDTPKNRAIIAQYNKDISDRLKAICDTLGYDFNKMSKLGTFEEECRIVRFKALKQKQYMFTDDKGQITVKASGCNRKNVENNDDVYSLDRIPVGEKVVRKSRILHPVEVVVDGIRYYQETSYENQIFKDFDAEIMTLLVNELFGIEKPY